MLPQAHSPAANQPPHCLPRTALGSVHAVVYWREHQLQEQAKVSCPYTTAALLRCPYASAAVEVVGHFLAATQAWGSCARPSQPALIRSRMQSLPLCQVMPEGRSAPKLAGRYCWHQR